MLSSPSTFVVKIRSEPSRSGSEIDTIGHEHGLPGGGEDARAFIAGTEFLVTAGGVLRAKPAGVVGTEAFVIDTDVGAGPVARDGACGLAVALDVCVGTVALRGGDVRGGGVIAGAMTIALVETVAGAEGEVAGADEIIGARVGTVRPTSLTNFVFVEPQMPQLSSTFAVIE